MNKLIKDGKVAVLYSPGYGAGWSTWNTDVRIKDTASLVFDPDIAQAILANNIKEAVKIAEKKYPDAYTGGMEQLTVTWVKQGQRFAIKEYDGYESVKIIEPNYFYVA